MKLLRIIFLLIFAFNVAAHPVIYQEGTVISSANMPEYSDNQLLYSFSNRFATGLNYWHIKEAGKKKSTDLTLARLNHLLYRYNGEDSQGNIYLLSGAGVLEKKWGDPENKAAYFAGAEVDWESRKHYAAAKYYQMGAFKGIDLHMSQIRLGFSPKFTTYENLQTWFMLQGMYLPEVSRSVVVTPLLRFFYHNVLWEMGSSIRGDWMLNLMVHY